MSNTGYSETGKESFINENKNNAIPSQGFSRFFYKFHLLAVFFAAVILSLSFQKDASAFWPLSDWPAKSKAAEETQVLPVNQAELLQQQIKKLAGQLKKNLEATDPSRGLLEEGLAICTFVDLKKLYRSNSFGRYIADQMINEFQQQEFRVVELRKTRDILIQQKRGEYSLSRDPDAINTEVAASAVLTGTYTMTPQQVIVNARIIDNRDSMVLSTAAMVFERSAMLNHLLADQTTARIAAQEIIYMKQLER